MLKDTNKPADEFPELVQFKSSVAKIYRTKNRDKFRYEVRHHNTEGGLQRETFDGYEDAKTFALDVVRKMASGGLDFLTLRGHAQYAYERACDLLHPLGLALDEAVAELVDLRKLANGSMPLREAVALGLKNQSKAVVEIRVKPVVDAFLAVKKTEELSDVYLRDLRIRLTRVANYFDCPISDITAKNIGEFLRSLKVSKRSRLNFLNTIGVLLNYARIQGHLASDHPGISLVTKIRKEAPTIGILTPPEFALMLGAAEPFLIPALLLNGFAGLRVAEIQRMDWCHVDLEDNFIEVPARLSKTHIRRLVPISDNLAAWLRNHYQKSGPLFMYKKLSYQIIKLAKKVGVTWKGNALRHAFISYRVAITKNIPQTAFEAGNSVNIIQRHYLKVVKEKQGLEWFAIMPPSAENATVLPIAAPIEEKQINPETMVAVGGTPCG